MLSLEQLREIIPNNKEPDAWLMYINRLAPNYGIDTDLRMIGFLSQSIFESNQFNDLFENLNYSAKRLREVWPKRFPSVSFALQYERNPQKIANYVYANRMGNGDETSGDGWKFRGRGVKQLTGRNNYTAFANCIGKTVDEAAVYAGTKEGAIETACWFWKENNLSRFADKQDVVGLTKAINGGLNGLSQREYHWNKVKKVIKNISYDKEEVAETPDTPLQLTPLGYRDTGELVKRVQEKLGLSADGIFGRNTQQAVRNWQKTNQYPISGYLTVKQLQELLNV